MAKSSTKKQTTQSQFSLKHRLIGAGILISFGVVILPWMLGSYSSDEPVVVEPEPKKEVKPSSIATLATKAASKTSAKQNDEKVEGDSEDKKDVKVFISRVQPLQRDENTPKNTQSAVKAPITSGTKNTTSSKKTSKPAPTKKPVAANKPTKKAPTKETVQPKPASKPKDTAINRGYIVSIGVFGDSKNVDKMVADLKSKQFQPLVRKETFKTKSVSRIYMGPFKTRAEAGKVKLRLSEKGIPKTLIKEFP